MLLLVFEPSIQCGNYGFASAFNVTALGGVIVDHP
jgi:hypothetical protein